MPTKKIRASGDVDSVKMKTDTDNPTEVIKGRNGQSSK